MCFVRGLFVAKAISPAAEPGATKIEIGWTRRRSLSGACVAHSRSSSEPRITRYRVCARVPLLTVLITCARVGARKNFTSSIRFPPTRLLSSHSPRTRGSLLASTLVLSLWYASFFFFFLFFICSLWVWENLLQWRVFFLFLKIFIFSCI